ncbi:SusC/RagA family TonB-linked outer membrane protein [Flavobacterium sp. I-SCBP12n]|uniref:SusC/RagA family TonB-linked outer membrane protein n=1 Tax=Flavobacterium pygoscelis TaxID=2893176 RepID=A0A9X2BLM3_9FLAO|nr:MULTISPECIES: SusC/RagA family TonB-linked outer membrane protein [Flavobacterium]MCK8141938.1 SusC/RagA family TonB-linked outer membrane protein [Flavobacterium pygoscelis]
MRLKFKWIFTLLLALSMQFSFAQEKTIAGVVSDATGPIPGVNVIVKGTNRSVQTDFTGNFSIKAKFGETLLFSFVGMDPVTKVIDASIMNVKMKDAGNVLEEVVVTALGIKKSAKAVGYAVQEVKAADLNKASNNSLAGALQGKLAGVQITPSSGAPGASSQIVIRGARSFTGNNTPLYVIDGMPVASTSDYSTGNSVTGADVANRAVDIDPADIESISILKGQAAAAIYGIRASNGVVVITTRSGKGLAKNGKPVISFNNSVSFETISKKPETQNIYAQGTQGKYEPTNSLSWGPKISELPNDPIYGGNVPNALNGGTLRPGLYYVPQRLKAGLDPWVAPKSYNNINDYFTTGVTINNSINIGQSTEKTNYSFGVGSSKQDGFMPGTGMNRYTVKGVIETKLNDHWKTGASFNYVQTKIDKSPSANDGVLAGVFGAPRSYDIKGIGFEAATNQYDQVYYRTGAFNNPYWAAKYNEFSEKTNRFYGNANIQYAPTISSDGSKKLTFKYQIGLDSYTTNFRDVFEFGSKHDLKGTSSNISLYGITSDVINSLFTVNYNMVFAEDFNLNVLVGNEYNHKNNKGYSDYGSGFNLGGFATISNARIVTSSEDRSQQRNVGFFGSTELSFRNFLFLNGTIREDFVSTMPRGNRDFLYPSASLSVVLTELEGLKQNSFLSFAKLRGSVAEVGQAGTYLQDFYAKPTYGGGFWGQAPIQYPIGDVSSFIPNTTLYDPNLKAQNTRSYELGFDFKFFNNRIGLEYTYSRQDVKDQIFAVPLAGSTGSASFVTNGGKIHTDAHEILLTASPVRTKDFEWNLSANFSKIDSYVDELAPGVESIFLGGFVTPQIRASVGSRFPVIYGESFKRDNGGNVIVGTDGLPMIGEAKAIGEVAPKFNLGGSTQFRYKRVSLGATFDWKNGGNIYSGSNSLMALYGVDVATGDREKGYVYPGVKADGSKNDIVLGGATNPNGQQNLYNRLSSIHESSVYDASFVKLREINLGYTFPKLLSEAVELRTSVFARNILLWSKLPNIDPEASQGNNNISGGFERLSIPQAKSIGFSLNLTF